MMIKSILATGFSFFLLAATPTAIAAQSLVSQTPTDASQTAESQATEASLENLEETIPPAKWALIQRLVDLTQSSQLLEQMFGDIFGGSESLMADVLTQSPQYQSASAEEQQEMLAQAQQVQTRLYELLTEEVDLIGISRKIEIYLYNKYYTEEDLENLLVFYQTPTGRKLVETLPRMTQDSIELSSRLVLPKMMNVFQTLMEELGELIEN